MKEYIERETIYKSACTGCTRHGDEIGSCFFNEPCEKLIFAFTTAPAADVVEVVRCCNCKFCVTHKAVPHCIKAFAQPEVGLMDFCSYGERKNNHEQTD